jgi:hypothetical protein
MTIISKHHQRGTAATEFMLALPFFLVLVFIIMEVSLMWVDKHFLRLAGFEAGRVFITSALENPCEDADLVRQARAVAGLRMAAVAPSVAEVFQTNRLEIKWDGFGQGIGAQIGGAAAHIIERLPAAMVLTELQCQYNSDSQIVDVNMTYRRTAKMPLVKHIIWGLYMIRNLGSDYFSMDSSYYDIEVKNPVAKPIGELRSVLTHWRSDVASAAAMLEAGGWGEDTSSWAMGWTQELDAGLNKAEQQIEDNLAATGKVVTAVIYAMPESLRLVPIRVTVSMRKSYYDRKGEEWKEGRAVAVAPFTSSGKDSPWYHWVRKIQDEVVDW